MRDGLFLKLEQVSKSFPGVKALRQVDLEFDKGEIHALLGENGAGKSTLIKIMGGIQKQDEGRLFLDGKELSFSSYRDAVEAGVGVVFQEFSLIPYLNAVENIFLGQERTNALGLLRKSEMKARAQGLFDKLGVNIDMDCPVAHLSVAEQQFVEIAKALSLDVKVLILDEPTATLTPHEADLLFNIMRDLKSRGVSIIFISHHLDEIFDVCDRVSVLRDGAHVGGGSISDFDMDRLVELMVGRKLEANFPPKATAFTGRTVLDVAEIRLTADGPTNHFSLREGEILGFAGLVGSGRTELALGVLGAIPSVSKKVSIDGQPVMLSCPADALKYGIGLLPESRKSEGLITEFGIRENISINNLGKYSVAGGVIDGQQERKTTLELMAALGIKAPDEDVRVANLSGGNQQKVVIARWLNHHCRVLVFDEPTRGIDVGAKAEIYALMRRLTAQGFAIIMISSELPEIIGMSDRVAVFNKGAIVTVLEADSIHSEEVMRHATASLEHAHVH